MENLYLKKENCVERLYREYKKHPRLIICADFDDSIYPWSLSKDTDFSRIFQLLRRAKNEHNFYIVLWTASAPERFDMMRKYCAENNLIIDSINENPIPLPFGNHKKIYYNLLLDDRAGLFGAVEILEELLRKIDMKKMHENQVEGI